MGGEPQGVRQGIPSEVIRQVAIAPSLAAINHCRVQRLKSGVKGGRSDRRGYDGEGVWGV